MKFYYNLEDFLNKRHSIRNLTDSEFDSAKVELAIQLESYDYKVKFSDKELRTDWQNLCKFNDDVKQISSTVRHGMKISEHFMDNFYDIKDPKGKSFSNQWTVINLEKILTWNRKSHSTPYLSEIKRGVYFCTGMTKNTMYRPTLTKLICNKYAKCGYVLDPCCGWGGRMMGTVASGANYIGFEPNTKTYNNLLKIVSFLGIGHLVQIYNDVAENIHKYDIPKINLILTSPPYYNLEIYSDETTQSVKNDQSYEEWINLFLKPVIKQSLDKGNDDVVSAWNVMNFGKIKMVSDVEKIHNSFGYTVFDKFDVISSKRQSNQNDTKNQKSIDATVCYRKI